jgi:phenylalanyl-tRNA synthetase alpha chain
MAGMAQEETHKKSYDKTLAELGATSPADVAKHFHECKADFASHDLPRITSEDDWKAVRDRWLGRKSGVLTLITNNWLKPAAPELKRAAGLHLNELKTEVEQALEERRLSIDTAAELAALERDRIDLSLPGVERLLGTRHLIRQTYAELQRIFLSIGYTVVEGPEIETPYYNFEALNIPEHHPARDNMDTFYIEGSNHLLRTHTSPMQIRTM